VLIASDSPTEHVDRGAASFEAVSTSKREKNEAARNFATRFYSKAQTYLRICGGAEDDPAGLVLALTFVENAHLSEDTRAHVKMQLQQSAVLAGKDRESSRGLSQNDLGTSDDEDGHDSSSDSSSSSESNDSDVTSQRLARRRRHKEKRRESRRRRRERFAVPEGLFEKQYSSVCFTLDDVCKALLVLPDDKGSFPPTMLQANIDHAVNKALMSRLGSSSGSGSSPGNGNSDSQSRPAFKCYACGKVGHRMYDCPEDIRQRCGHCGKPGHPVRECFLKHGMMGKSPQEKAKF
jgi:Zinc knuckle